MTTPRDDDSIRIRKWADTGDRQTPEAAGLSRTTGFDISFAQVGGRRLTRELVNQMFAEPTGMLAEINEHGLLGWDSRVDYVHPAVVVGTNEFIYRSRQDSGPSSVVSNPVTDTGTYWERVFANDFNDLVTYEALNGNGDVGAGSSQLSRGNHSHSAIQQTYVSGRYGHNSSLATDTPITTVYTANLPAGIYVARCFGFRGAGYASSHSVTYGVYLNGSLLRDQNFRGVFRIVFTGGENQWEIRNPRRIFGPFSAGTFRLDVGVTSNYYYGGLVGVDLTLYRIFAR